ncbi:MAG: site-specific integrase [Bifidobacteriaceae bacterium]|jgi:integrase|nr:site-specific integrase [Bifidobacteriaceae bacterium]
MSRPRLDVGTFGQIVFLSTPSGMVEARVRFRDHDGKRRQVQATARTQGAAERALKCKLATRATYQPGDGSLTADSLFADLAAYWLDDIELEGRITQRTRENYEWNMLNLVVPVFGQLTLREIGVARCDRFIKSLAKKSYSQARQAKNVLRLAFGLAVRHEVIVRNPMDGIARLHRPPHVPDAMTPSEVNAVRTAVAFWEVGLSASGPKPDGQLSAIIEVMLGTSARIGEALAIRIKDVDVTGPCPSIRIGGTITSVKGNTAYRQNHPKTARSRRTVAIPSFTAEAVRRRLAVLDDHSPDALLFCSRNGTPLTTNNVRRQLRHVLNLAGIEGVTPHSFRRAVATAVNESVNVELAAELLGHADPKITIQHYIRRSEMVNPATAGVLEEYFAPER